MNTTVSAHPIVIALGGNAISPEGEQGNIDQQFARSRETVVHLADLIEHGYHLVITHGNGPQIGNVLRRVELASDEIYPLPVDICVSDTQGGMGYMIAQCLNNELRHRGRTVRAGTLITSVEVDPDDPDFKNPTKPIGTWYDADRGRKLAEEYGWDMTTDSNGRMRRVVASPLPMRIVEIDLIRDLAKKENPLVAAGGGGIPVVNRAEPGQPNKIVGCDAVIDKDRTSALLAKEIDASMFIIVTSVDSVLLDFNKPTQRPISCMTVSEARNYLEEGQFPPGSMGPKIEAAIDFIENSDNPDVRVIICDLQHIVEAVAGRSGTEIVVE